MHTVVTTADAALVRRLSGRLGRKHVAVGMPDEAGCSEIRVPDDFAERGGAAVRRLLQKQPWRKLSPDERALFVRRHRGFLRDVTAAAGRSHVAVIDAWYGRISSRWIESHLTAAYLQLTGTV